MSHYLFGADPYAGCWFADLADAGGCDGRLQRCHLIPRQVIRREVWQSRRWKTSGRLDGMTFADLVMDPRVLVAGCIRHHYRLDESRKLRVAREWLPRAVEDYAAEWELTWWLDRSYPPQHELVAA